MHSLFLASRVDRYNAGVNDDHDSNYQVMFFQDDVCYQWNDIEGLVVSRVQFNHHDQQICPREHRAVSHTPDNVDNSLSIQIYSDDRQLGTCESAVCVRIEYRIELDVTAKINLYTS